MKKILYNIVTLLLVAFAASSCDDDISYAQLVDQECEYISLWTDYKNIDYTSWDEEKLQNVTNAILKDSIDPAEFITLGKWYEITEGDFKRLMFRVNSWGKQSFKNNASASFYENKFKEGSYALVRYDSLYNLSTFDYKKPKQSLGNKGDNLDPNSYEVIYNWRQDYYSSTYYGSYYSSGSNYECTSGGLGFPLRFLWYGGDVSLIVPFSLVSSTYSSAYYTLYYGHVIYKYPNYLPQ